MAAWITETTNYYSTASGTAEYHNGGWVCHEGGQIKALHLTSGKGGRTIECPVCKAHREGK